MATSQETAHGLKYYQGADITSWLNGFNPLVLKIEELIQELEDTQEGDKATLQSAIDSINSTIASIQSSNTIQDSNILALQTSLTNINTSITNIQNDIGNINDSLNNVGVIESIVVSQTLNANVLKELTTVTLPAGKYFIVGQVGSISPNNILSLGVSIPNVQLLKKNNYGNTISFYYETQREVTLSLHVTINLTTSTIGFSDSSDYIQAIRLTT